MKTTKRSDTQLDELLAPKQLSAAEHDRVLDAVLQRVASKPKSWSLQSYFAGFGLALASVMGLFFLAPHLSEPGFRAKGGRETLVVEAVCIPEGCRPGDRLVIALSTVTQAGFANVYATSPSGRTVWYFSAAAAPRVPVSQERTILEKSVILGQDHEEVGTWTLHVVLSRDPADAATILGRRSGHELEGFAAFRVEP